MKATFLHLLIHLYGAFLRLYPQRFRVEFEDEMQAVFSQSLEQAARQGIASLADVTLREVLHAPLTLLRVHRFSRKEKERTTSDPITGFSPVPRAFFPPPPPDGRESWMQAGLEASLFLSTGAIMVLLTYLPLAWPASDPLYRLGSSVAIVLLLPALGFPVGLARGLPRWAYPFGGILLGYGLLAAIRFDLLPFLAAFLVASVVLALAAVVVNSRVQPLPPSLQRLGQSIGLDPTRLSFCIYGAMPLMITLAFDDGRYNNRTPYLAISVLLMVAGAFAYVRSRRTVLQMTALLGGMSLSVGCALFDHAYWTAGLGSWISSPGPWLAGTGWIMKLWAIGTVGILAPFLLRLARRASTPERTA
jgi:hypothetical protein